MLDKRALEVIQDNPPSFCSHHVVVEQTTGDCRLIKDLSSLNCFMYFSWLKMKTIALVLLSIRNGDWMTSIALKNV